jgi:hypothetical protein
MYSLFLYKLMAMEKLMGYREDREMMIPDDIREMQAQLAAARAEQYESFDAFAKRMGINPRPAILTAVPAYTRAAISFAIDTAHATATKLDEISVAGGGETWAQFRERMRFKPD